MKKWYFLSLAGMVGCISRPSQPVATSNDSKVLITVVADYSKSYCNLVMLDSNSISALIATVANTGGTIAHIAVQDNSSTQPVYLAQIEKIDTTSTAGERNMYKAARLRETNKRRVSASLPMMQQHTAEFLQVVRSYMAGTSYTDLQHGLALAHNTVCEPLYTSGTTPYTRYVLILSDMLNDPPYTRGKPLEPVSFCDATVLIVRPSYVFSQDSLQKICGTTQVHVFTTLQDAISFIHQQ